jgi:hypothetical protein
MKMEYFPGAIQRSQGGFGMKRIQAFRHVSPDTIPEGRRKHVQIDGLEARRRCG